MPDANRLDRLLAEAGEQWRATQPPGPLLQQVWRAPARTFDIHWGWVVLVAVVATLAGSLVIGGGKPGPSPLAPPSPVAIAWDEPQVRAAEVRVGDLVTATGILWAKAGEPPLLCADAFDILMFGVPPSCSPPDVPLAGSLDLSRLPGRQVVGDVTFSSGVRVVGRWTGTAIEDVVITSAPLPGYRDPLPCLTPAAGWANPATSGAFRAELDPLAREITAHPELYAGYYTQSVSPGDSFPAVEIVRTKVDPRTLVSRIQAIFPYAVCLTRDYSQVELDAAIAAFPRPPTTIPAISGDTHRVGVAIVAVDDQTLPVFLAHPAAYPIPLVTKYIVQPSPNPSPSIPSSCPATLRTDDPGPLASQTAKMSLPGSLVPYGAPQLWATIPRSGSLSSSTSTSGGLFVRTFWYSDRWSITDEPSPSISVAAGRLGGGESVIGSAAVSAHSRELGDSMIVSLDLPFSGCWQITGTYRDQSLSYVVWVQSETSGPIVSDATDYPVDIDGVPVTKAADAPAALAATKPGESILIGGWLKPYVFMSCPDMQTFPDVWNVCSAIQLAVGPWGGEFVGVYHPTSDAASLPTIPDGQVEPVVLRVHSHDPGCPSSYDCASLAVLDAVVWLGQVGPAPPVMSTQPPDGISKADAERIAVEEAQGAPQRSGGVTVVSSRSGHYADVGPMGSSDVAGDRWVWAVVVSGHFTTPHCSPPTACLSSVQDSLIVLDYVTGVVLLQETPAPPSASDAAEARTRLAKYLDAIGGRYWDLAWGFLSAYSQQRYGSERAFIEAVTADAGSTGSVQIGDPVALMSSDLVDSGFFEPGLLADVEATVAVSRAFVISTVDPSVDGASAGSRTYVVAALSDTEWRIWIGH